MKRSGSRPSAKHGAAAAPILPARGQMDRLLRRCGLELSAEQLALLWQYHQLLRRHDAELNLTRIRNFENMVVKLYADSMLPALHTALPSPLMDLGSGPGMPGILLKIFRPDLHVLLAESRRPRIDFLKIAVAELSLSGIEVIERGIAADFDRPVAGVITRAVEPIAATLARIAGCLEKAGTVIFMKGPRCDEEIGAAAESCGDDYALSDDIPYQIPHSPHQRRLVCYRRLTSPRTAAAPPPMHRIHAIESESNPVFKDLKKLLGGRGIKKQGRTLVCGRRLVDEALARHPERCLAWITSGEQPAPAAEAPPHMQWLQLAPGLFQHLDLFGTRQPLLLCSIPQLPVWPPDGALPPGCSLLIPFQDPENVGAVIRCAAAFDVQCIVLLTESANPFHPKAIRASAGTVFTSRLYQGPSLDRLEDSLPVVALAADGHPLKAVAFPPAFCLLAGMEGPGLPPRWQTKAVAIPMAGGVESLNAAVATAIALYEWRRRNE